MDSGRGRRRAEAARKAAAPSVMPRLVKPSTRAFLDEARGLSGYSLLDRLHGYIYLRWPYLYIGVGTGEHRLARPLLAIWRFIGFSARRSNGAEPPVEPRCVFADGYHGKVVPPDEARELVTVNKALSLRAPEQVIPYSRARDIVLRNPDHIVALDCPCRSARPNPCRPLDVCLVVGEPFAGFVVEHHPERAKRITPERATEILQEEHGRGHVHHAFFKDAMLGRFYAICNCCACCCGAMQAFRKGVPMLASSGYVSRIDGDLCNGCERCVDTCQFGAIRMGDLAAVVDEALCMGCGVCVSQCDVEAAMLVRDPTKGEPLALHELSQGASAPPSAN